jgi:hypothetical protein
MTLSLLTLVSANLEMCTASIVSSEPKELDR